MQYKRRLVELEDYQPLVGEETIRRVQEKARAIQHLHVTHVNSTYYGGGVATLLGSLSILMNCVGIKTGWRVMWGSPTFFNITKKIHNALQGGEEGLTNQEKEDFEDIVFENSIRNHLAVHDRVIIHDPQPLPLINHYQERGPWIWRCHIDLSQPNEEVWAYLKQFVDRYDAAILSLEEYAQELKPAQVFFMPAIDPFTIKNRPMAQDDILDKLNEYNIPTDRPIVSQISRFDRWKDPQGVLRAYELASEEIDATLVLLGNFASDDPEGEQIYKSLTDNRSHRIKILSVEDSALVNALQSYSAVVLQKSLREGFGLTVAEAMWKGTPVIGGNVGGIKHQIEHGSNGYLVSSDEEAAECIIRLIKDEDLRQQIGQKARQTVQERFLMVRLMEQYLDLLSSFEVRYYFKGMP